MRVRNVVLLLLGWTAGLGWIPATVWAMPQQPAADLAQGSGTDTGTREAWREIRFTAHIGGTLSTLGGGASFDAGPVRGFSPDFGFAVGFAIELPVAERFSIQGEVQLARKSADLDSAPGIDTRSKLAASYLELPLLAKFYPRRRQGIAWNIVTGPALSTKVEATREVREGGQVFDLPAGDLVEATDIGWLSGVGVELDDAFAALTLELRYSVGLNDIRRAPTVKPLRWRALYFLIGIAF